MLEFRSKGTPYERGLAQGMTFATLIMEHIAVTCQIDARYEEEIAQLLSAILSNVKTHAPSILEEMRGIAEGAGVSLFDILKLSYWPEVTSATVGLCHCSLIAFSDIERGPIIAKNSDHALVSIRFLALQRVENLAGHSYVRGTFVGTNGTRAGVNQAGLALCGATIIPRTINPQGVPVMVLMQKMLEKCATVGDAIALAERMPVVNYGAHIMVGDASGDVVVIERLPERMGLRQTEQGVQFNTNHPLAAETLEHNGADKVRMANSQARYCRLKALLHHVPRTVEGVQGILRDHTQPGAICRHGGDDGMHTTSSYVLLPARRMMWMAAGCPCQYPYFAVPIDS